MYGIGKDHCIPLAELPCVRSKRVKELDFYLGSAVGGGARSRADNTKCNVRFISPLWPTVTESFETAIPHNKKQNSAVFGSPSINGSIAHGYGGQFRGLFIVALSGCETRPYGAVLVIPWSPVSYFFFSACFSKYASTARRTSSADEDPVFLPMAFKRFTWSGRR